MNDAELQESLAAVAKPPVYSGDVMVDRLYDMVLRLTQELAVTREEVALLRQALGDPARLDELAAAPEFAQSQLEQHSELIQRVLGDLPGSGG